MYTYILHSAHATACRRFWFPWVGVQARPAGMGVQASKQGVPACNAAQCKGVTHACRHMHSLAFMHEAAACMLLWRCLIRPAWVFKQASKQCVPAGMGHPPHRHHRHMPTTTGMQCKAVTSAGTLVAACLQRWHASTWRSSRHACRSTYAGPPPFHRHHRHPHRSFLRMKQYQNIFLNVVYVI